MKANLTKVIDNVNPSHRKDFGLVKSYTLIDFNETTKKFHEQITVRIYMPGENRVYCCYWVESAWVGSEMIHKGFCGSGTASGYGYDKYSAAFASALMNSKVVLDEDISGRGVNMIEEAMKTIYLEMHGENNPFTIISAHA